MGVWFSAWRWPGFGKGGDAASFSLALPIAGLLSDEPLEVVVEKFNNMERVAVHLGTTLSSLFSTLFFVAMPVIPELRLTDLGLVDVGQFRLIS